jgi:hypothetical protein
MHAIGSALVGLAVATTDNVFAHFDDFFHMFRHRQTGVAIRHRRESAFSDGYGYNNATRDCRDN